MNARCPICGYENPVGAVFCSDCSAELPKGVLVCEVPAFPETEGPAPSPAAFPSALPPPSLARPTAVASPPRAPAPLPVPIARVPFADADDAPEFPRFGPAPAIAAAPPVMPRPTSAPPVAFAAAPLSASWTPAQPPATEPPASASAPLVNSLAYGSGRPSAVPVGTYYLAALDKHDRDIGRFPLHEGENVIGVAAVAESHFPDVDLTLIDKHQIVSRRHASIAVGGAVAVLTHLSRSNPTHVNDRLVRPESPVELRVGDRIVFSTNVLCIFRRS
jgi:hypothetical protein